MVKVKDVPKSTVVKTQIDWAKKLKRIKLKDLKQVSTFSKGANSLVSLVQLSDFPDSSFVLKSIQKAKITTPVCRQSVLTEKWIHSGLKSDFIVKMYKTFKDNKRLHFLCEYLPGGELFDLAPVSDDGAKFYVACVVEALDHLHARNIVHNDIKPENLVLDRDGYAKLIDFGVARKVQRGETVSNSGGTWKYLPPEVAAPFLANKYHTIKRDRAVDLWALGVVAYELLGYEVAFDRDGARSGKDICENIMAGIRSVPFPREQFSEEAEDFICSLCVEDPNGRLGYNDIDEIRKHPWFKDFEWNELRNRTMKPPMVPKVDGVLDTHNFHVEIYSDTDAEVDESDWDMDF